LVRHFLQNCIPYWFGTLEAVQSSILCRFDLLFSISASGSKIKWHFYPGRCRNGLLLEVTN
jgi:hypothetical protein